MAKNRMKMSLDKVKIHPLGDCCYWYYADALSLPCLAAQFLCNYCVLSWACAQGKMNRLLPDGWTHYRVQLLPSFFSTWPTNSATEPVNPQSGSIQNKLDWALLAFMWWHQLGNKRPGIFTKSVTNCPAFQLM